MHCLGSTHAASVKIVKTQGLVNAYNALQTIRNRFPNSPVDVKANKTNKYEAIKHVIGPSWGNRRTIPENNGGQKSRTPPPRARCKTASGSPWRIRRRCGGETAATPTGCGGAPCGAFFRRGSSKDGGGWWVVGPVAAFVCVGPDASLCGGQRQPQVSLHWPWKNSETTCATRNTGRNWYVLNWFQITNWELATTPATTCYLDVGATSRSDPMGAIYVYGQSATSARFVLGGRVLILIVFDFKNCKK